MKNPEVRRKNLEGWEKNGEWRELAVNENGKAAIVRAIWRRTTVPQGSIAERLKMMHAANVSLALRRSEDDLLKMPPALRVFLNVQGNVP